LLFTFFTDIQTVIGNWLLVIGYWLLPITNHQSPITKKVIRIFCGLLSWQLGLLFLGLIEKNQ
jgi:hypothetical protein